MRYAFNDNGTLRDVTSTDPFTLFQEDYAAKFITVNDNAENGWIWKNGEFSPFQQDIFSLKEQKNTEINEARLSANFSTFPYSGKVFACDQLSRSDIDGTNGFVSLYGTLPPAWPGGWKAVDNTYISIVTVQDWKDFYSSMFAQGNANFINAQALKDKLQLAATAQEIQEITWGMEL